MPTRVHLSDGRIVNFPDGMPPDQIKAAVGKLSGPAEPTRDPAIPDPATFLPMSEGERAFYDTVRKESAAYDGDNIREMAFLMTPTGGAGRLLTAAKAPAGRALATGGKALERAGRLTKPLAPMAVGGALLTGDLSTAAMAAAPYAARAGGRALQKAGTKLATRAAQTVGKPKLTAQQAKQMLRTRYGSEKGGQMLYGRARTGLTAADRQALMKSGTTGGSLPQAAKRAIEKEIAASTPEEAFAYAAKAPNAPAQAEIGEMLRRALLERAGK